MSDAVPDWVTGGPPASAPAEYRGSGNAKQGGGGYQRVKLTPEQAAFEQDQFFKWLNAPSRKRELAKRLPARIPVEGFIEVAAQAANRKPDLLLPALRESLLIAVMDAADDGLQPDGREGALIPRWDSESRSLKIVWQPMVWGVVKLGRETGAIRSIRAELVFEGETFRVIAGDEDRIVHEYNTVKRDEAYAALNSRDEQGNLVLNPEGFIARLVGAYCIFTAVDGAVTKRSMTRARLASLRDSSKAKAGPWNSPFLDEMFLKATILFTSKWVNLDASSTESRQNMARFQAALMRDMHVDLATIEGDKVGDKVPNGVGLIGFETKLDVLERAFTRPKEKVRRAAPAKREASTAKNGVSAEAETGKAAQGASEGSQTDEAESLREQDRFKGGADDPGFDNGRDHPDASLSSTSNEGAKPEAKPQPPKTENEVHGWYYRTVKVVNAFTDEAAMDKQLAGSITAKWIECINDWYPDVATDFRMLVEDRRSFIRQIPKK